MREEAGHVVAPLDLEAVQSEPVDLLRQERRQIASEERRAPASGAERRSTLPPYASDCGPRFTFSWTSSKSTFSIRFSGEPQTTTPASPSARMRENVTLRMCPAVFASGSQSIAETWMGSPLPHQWPVKSVVRTTMSEKITFSTEPDPRTNTPRPRLASWMTRLVKTQSRMSPPVVADAHRRGSGWRECNW